MHDYVKVFLKPKKEESLKRFHPWVFSGAIRNIEGEPAEGEVVNVYDVNGRFLAVGHYQIGSIAVRLLAFEERIIDKDFWKQRIEKAYGIRKMLGLVNGDINNTFRLVHGEGDSLPGLVIDVYAHTAVMQAHSVGMHHARMAIAEAIMEVSEGAIQNVYYKSEATLPYKADIEPEDGYIVGGNVEDIAVENSLKFYVDWLRGQKTGFFVDQRDNRSLLEKYSK
ncbi:MAG: class I SAM-dependent rRNA methyltransferase, partial [Tannerellaceae bacterium]